MMNKNVLNTDLRGKVAVVTGASGVLCSRFSVVLARAGAKVAMLALDEESSLPFVEQIRSEGGMAKAYACNVLDRERCMEVADRVKEDLGPCDILINGAGGNAPGATTDSEYWREEAGEMGIFNLEPDSVRSVFDLNFMGTLIPVQAFARQMAGREGCCVVNISSMNAFTPLTRIPAYSGAKAAVSNFTRWLAVHFSKMGIRVNAIAPGFFASAQNAKLLWNDDGSPTERTRKILAATPMGRFGENSELEGALLFLVNEKAAGFITGVVLPVDGGFSAYSGV